MLKPRLSISRPVFHSSVAPLSSPVAVNELSLASVGLRSRVQFAPGALTNKLYGPLVAAPLPVTTTRKKPDPRVLFKPGIKVALAIPEHAARQSAVLS